MLISRSIDTKAMNLLKQGKTFFHIAGAGHEAIQVAAGLQLNPQVDWLFPYYRDLALVLTAGLYTKRIFLQCFAKEDDPACGGRQLPCHWGHNKFNLTCTIKSHRNPVPSGSRYSSCIKKKKIDSISYVSSGEGTTSQGEFHEAINWASREKLPVLFVIQNNKYAISVPVEHAERWKG
jgi:TPP-dependent pyruvate/acetoin dehydrogenase alpha subunit